MRVLVGVLACVWLMAAASSVFAQAPRQVTDDTFFPAYFVDDVGRACVARFNLSPSDLEERRNLMREMLFKTSVDTDFWRRSEYRVDGVDYADLRYFHVVSRNDCHTIQKVLEMLSTMPGIVRDMAGDAAGRALVEDMKEIGATFGAAIRHFMRTRSPETTKICLVTAKIDYDPLLDRLIKELVRLARYPFLDVSFEVHKSFSFVLSSHCKERQKIMESFRLDLMKHFLPEAASWQFDYGGDANEFLRAYR